LVLEAARAIVIAEGPAGVTMRKIAGQIGYAAGSIYNAVGDQAVVLRHVNAQTLRELVAALESAVGSAGFAPGDIRRAEVIAEAYIDYVVAHARLWAALLERPPLPGEEVPEFYARPRARLVEMVAEAIAPFFKDPSELRDSVVALWSALQGIASLAAGGNVSFLGDGIDPKRVARTLVRRYLA
jgi:AcrR family transcriptional regulator